MSDHQNQSLVLATGSGRVKLWTIVFSDDCVSSHKCNIKSVFPFPQLVFNSSLPTGELPGQMLSFAANTIYMAISCSNVKPKTEPGENPNTGKNQNKSLFLFDLITGDNMKARCFLCTVVTDRSYFSVYR